MKKIEKNALDWVRAGKKGNFVRVSGGTGKKGNEQSRERSREQWAQLLLCS
jgi:hypothetical protein